MKTALNFTELNYMFFDKRKRSTIYTLVELPFFDKTKSPREDEFSSKGNVRMLKLPPPISQ